MKLIIKNALFSTLFILLTVNVYADADPKIMLQQVADNIVNYLEKNKEKLKSDENLAIDLVKRELLPYIDQEGLGRRVLAKEWKNASPEQQKLFVEKFVDLVIKTYAKGLAQYDGQSFLFEETEYGKNNAIARVKSEMKQKDGAPVKIDYWLKKPKGLDEWRVVDVSIEGISMATSYRNQFAQQIEKEGLDAVIQKLANNEIELK
jgi:phospholipid transport system substrate-binding protein